MKKDIEIANEAVLKPITKIAKQIGLNEDDIELYGKYKAKIGLDVTNKINKNGKVILVTAITPTKAGEGKTTVSIGLAQAMKHLKKDVVLALREPSLGPVMGLKGGATGGGYSQVVPMDDINLHFTGDLHAITAANNLISAAIDNHIYYGNNLDFDLERIVWKRCLDVNDRSLRSIRIGMGSKFNGVERDESFNITVASEMMAIFCLAKDLDDLRNRLDNILLGYNTNGEEILLKELGITGSLLALLKDAIKPNLVQSLEGVPALIHGGPFANIAHGCNSIMATNMAMHLAEYTVTEAGFGADLGAEKFLDIKSRIMGIKPSVVVIVATIRALKMHGGVEYENLAKPNTRALKRGLCNLAKHIDTIKRFNLPYVVAINKFYQDSDGEIKALKNYLKENGHPYELCDIFAQGGKGGIKLAKVVMDVIDKMPNDGFKYLYEQNDSIEQKIYKIATKAYGAKDIEFSKKALEQLNTFKKMGYDKLLVCIAKTQNSLTDDGKVLGAPTDFLIHIKELRLSRGAGFIVALTGKILTMPGLPEHPQAMDIEYKDMKVVGLN